MTMGYQPPKVGGYSVAARRTMEARQGAWEYFNAHRVADLMAQGASEPVARKLAGVEADAYAQEQMRRFAYVGPAFWVALALAVPTFGLSLVVHLGWWVSKRRVLLGMPAPLEGLTAKQVIR